MVISVVHVDPVLIFKSERGTDNSRGLYLYLLSLSGS